MVDEQSEAREKKFAVRMKLYKCASDSIRRPMNQSQNIDTHLKEEEIRIWCYQMLHILNNLPTQILSPSFLLCDNCSPIEIPNVLCLFSIDFEQSVKNRIERMIVLIINVFVCRKSSAFCKFNTKSVGQLSHIWKIDGKKGEKKLWKMNDNKNAFTILLYS